MKNRNIKIISGDAVTTKTIECMIDLDKKVYPQDMCGELVQCIKWHLREPKIYFVLMKEESIIGYINLMPLNPIYMDEFKKGDIIDVSIDESNFIPYHENRETSLYLSSIVIDPTHQGMGLFNLLWEQVSTHIDELKKTHIIKELVADAISKDGERVCLKIGMIPIGSTSHGSIIFCKKYE